MQKKFGALRIIGAILKIFGIIIAVVTVLGAILTLIGFSASGPLLRSMMGPNNNLDLGGAGFFGGLLGAFGVLIGGGISALTTYAMGELLYLLLAIEENTRGTSQLPKG